MGNILFCCKEENIDETNVQIVSNKSFLNNQFNKSSTNLTNKRNIGSSDNNQLDYSPNRKDKINKNSQILNSSNVFKDVKINTINIINQKECSPSEGYIIDKKLGEGSYGEVYRVRHKQLGIIRAMKRIVRRTKSIESEIEINNEINLLKSIDHPNIVKIVEFYVTKQAYFIITELCSGGELFDKIMEKEKLDEEHASYIMFQVLSAILFCHNKNIVHRDLKPENILIDREEENGYYNIKIIDFGTAKIFEKDKAEQKVIGSAYYIAPEVLDKNYNEKCDLWSCGVILYILLTGKPPFGGSEDEIIRKIKRGFYDESELRLKSEESRNLIKKLLEMNPNNRLSAYEALKHPWFEKTRTRERIISMKDDKLSDYISKLKNFKYQSKFQETALAFLVHNCLHLDEVREIYKVFSAIDLDCDGKITQNELFVSLKNFYNNNNINKSDKIIQDEIKIIFRNIDNDGNNSIEYEEFVRAVIGKDKLLSDVFMRHTFDFFDKDKSGEITIEEMKEIFNNEIDEKIIIKIVQEIDIDGNQEINFEEFKIMMDKLLSK